MLYKFFSTCDELEACNPLGSKANIHKLGMTHHAYFCQGMINPFVF